MSNSSNSDMNRKNDKQEMEYSVSSTNPLKRKRKKTMSVTRDKKKTKYSKNDNQTPDNAQRNGFHNTIRARAQPSKPFDQDRASHNNRRPVVASSEDVTYKRRQGYLTVLNRRRATTNHVSNRTHPRSQQQNNPTLHRQSRDLASNGNKENMNPNTYHRSRDSISNGNGRNMDFISNLKAQNINPNMHSLENGAGSSSFLSGINSSSTSALSSTATLPSVPTIPPPPRPPRPPIISSTSSNSNNTNQNNRNNTHNNYTNNNNENNDYRQLPQTVANDPLIPPNPQHRPVFNQAVYNQTYKWMQEEVWQIMYNRFESKDHFNLNHMRNNPSGFVAPAFGLLFTKHVHGISYKTAIKAPQKQIGDAHVALCSAIEQTQKVMENIPSSKWSGPIDGCSCGICIKYKAKSIEVIQEQDDEQDDDQDDDIHG